MKKIERIQKAIDKNTPASSENRFKNGTDADETISRITEEINANILKLKINTL